MNRRDFLKCVGTTATVGAATASTIKEKYASQHAASFIEPAGPVTVGKEVELPTSVTLPRDTEVIVEEGAVKVREASYISKFKLSENVRIGDTVEINESGEIQRARRGSIPVGTVIKITTDCNTGNRECDIAMHGWLGYVCE
jgi:UDP-3-O-[3-hydroxymyristoyl] glucosamine N-acyltransferase